MGKAVHVGPRRCDKGMAHFNFLFPMHWSGVFICLDRLPQRRGIGESGKLGFKFCDATKRSLTESLECLKVCVQFSELGRRKLVFIAAIGASSSASVSQFSEHLPTTFLGLLLLHLCDEIANEIHPWLTLMWIHLRHFRGPLQHGGRYPFGGRLVRRFSRSIC